MTASRAGDRRPPAVAGFPSAEPKNVPCPRCESTNTKFCYYNNYNLSQPRHFCKSCRRYWTRGGTIRNIPYGGSHRKSSKRPPRLSPVSSSSSSSSSAPPPPPPPSDQVLVPQILVPDQSLDVPFFESLGSPLSLQNEDAVAGLSFSSLLGFMGVNEFVGLGAVASSDETGIGSKLEWPGMVVDPAVMGGDSGGSGAVGNSWQVTNLGGFDGCCPGISSDGGGGDFFPWPELAVSTPLRGLE